MLNTIQTSNLALPLEGSKLVSETLDFSLAASFQIDLTEENLNDRIAFVQSVWIDNADNPANCDLFFSGGPTVQRIRATPYSQGWYPVSWPLGALRASAVSSGGVKVGLMFANFAMAYATWQSPGGAS